MTDISPEETWDDTDDDWMVGNKPTELSSAPDEHVTAALVVVETAFLASTTALIWLVTTYIPPTGVLLRMFFSLPVALACLRWNRRTSWMTAIVAGLLLSVLMGPPRSIQFFMPYGVLGAVLGECWRSKVSWALSMGWGILISAAGLFFQIALLSLLLGTNVWLYVNQQVMGILDWFLVKFNILVTPDVVTIQIFAVGLIFLNAFLYVLLVHLIASLLFERLNYPIPAPPEWLEAFLED